MKYALTGFAHDGGLRVFRFEGLEPDRSRVVFTVGVDLGLAREYRIGIQELPLLCRRFLEARSSGSSITALTVPEATLLAYADERDVAKRALEERRGGFRRSSS